MVYLSRQLVYFWEMAGLDWRSDTGMLWKGQQYPINSRVEYVAKLLIIHDLRISVAPPTGPDERYFLNCVVSTFLMASVSTDMMMSCLTPFSAACSDADATPEVALRA